MSAAELVKCRQDDLSDLAGTVSLTHLRNVLAETRGLFSVPAPGDYYLSKIGLLSAYRGKGLGRVLVSDWIAAARQRSASRLTLDGWAGNNRAIELYLSFGLVETRVSSSSHGFCYKTFALPLRESTPPSLVSTP